MESIVNEGTPLAAFLEGEELREMHGARQLLTLSGEGTFEQSCDQSDHSQIADSQDVQSFAPPSSSSLRSRFKDRVPPGLRVRLPHKSRLSEAHIAWSRAINSRIGRSENEHFIEHFRYILIASQLVNENQDHGNQRPSSLSVRSPGHTGPATDSHGYPLDFRGLSLTAGVAFLFVWLTRWAYCNQHSKTRVLAVFLSFAVVAVLTYVYVRRQWLKYVRHLAVESASGITTNLQALELSSGAAMSLIQEVELVSRGYRISAPMPPISRLDDAKANRRCNGLRKQLCKIYMAIIPALIQGIETLRESMNGDTYDRFLDVYDVPREAVQEVMTAQMPVDEDVESLGALRSLTYRYSTLRRMFLCSLLSLEADGGAPDFPRWRLATNVMDHISQIAATNASLLSQSLQDLDDFATPTSPKATSKPTNERLRSQVRKISTLSQGIRTLQAKMALLREDSTRAIASSDDLTDLGPSLMAQYESIGGDLRSLMQDWETGKAALASNIGRQERRISLASSGLRSPGSSLGGLTAVDEDSEAGGIEAALRALTGEKEEPRSNRSSLAANSDEEVFEAVAMPRVRERSALSREERIARMNEERNRLGEVREKRMSSTNMMRELQSVINLRRPPGRNELGRITSI